MNKVCSKTATWIVVLMLIVPGSVLHAEDPPSSQRPDGPKRSTGFDCAYNACVTSGTGQLTP